MNKAVKRGLHLLIISAVVAIFGVLTAVGVSANVDDTFVVNTVEGAPITYTITSIDKYAFIYHEKLGTITIPSNGEYIDDSAFSCCGFNKMIVNRETPPELGEGVFSYSTEFELVVPSGSEGDYKAAGWPI